MERRLGALEFLYRADARTVSEASYDIEWAVRWPNSADPVARAARIREGHDLDDGGIQRSIETAFARCGVPRDAARQIAALGLENVLTIAAAAAPEVA